MHQTKRSQIIVKKAFEKSCTIWFAAPYSLSQDVSFSEGMILNLSEHEELDEPYRYEIFPLDSEGWAPFLISETHRFDNNFRHSYNSYLTEAELEQYCEPVEVATYSNPTKLKFHHALQGCLFGTAVADAIGLPFEGLSSRRIKKLNVIPLRHRFIFGCGMLSDDTEHTCIVAHALIESKEDLKLFSNALAWSLRWWFLGLPAGIGMATLRACLKLWLFIPVTKSGVFSAGNGPAMRTAILGTYAYDDETLRSALVTINTQITHTDPKAIKGSKIVAELTARNVQGVPLTVDNCLIELGGIIGDDEELRILLSLAVESAKSGQSALEYCQENKQEKGVSGYIYNTLPVVVQIVLRHNDDYEKAITEAITCGGDTDTVAAIIGGIVGANVGKAGIPADWIDNLKDWPRDKNYIRLLGEELAVVKWSKQVGRTQWMDPIRLLLRNAFFMLWVLGHGFRRLLPPY